MWPFASEDEALRDALRLSEGMSLKSAVAGLRLGGGKSVILGDPSSDKSPALLRAFGRCVEGLAGRYVAAEDVGIRVDDIEVMGLETQYVAGRHQGLSASGDPSPYTARGVHAGLRLAATQTLDRSRLQGLRVAVQGVGSVGMRLCERLHAEGAQLLVSDPSETRAREASERFQAEVIAPEAIIGTACDVFAPCALGGILDDEGVRSVRARVIAGAANNQLATPEHADALATRGILYVPDFVLNAGGIVNVAAELEGDYDSEAVGARVDAIAHRVATLLRDAEASGATPNSVAHAWAAQKLGRTGQSGRRAERTPGAGTPRRPLLRVPVGSDRSTGSRRNP
jgi:leucine dehydrogenase